MTHIDSNQLAAALFPIGFLMAMTIGGSAATWRGKRIAIVILGIAVAVTQTMLGAGQTACYGVVVYPIIYWLAGRAGQAIRDVVGGRSGNCGM